MAKRSPLLILPLLLLLIAAPALAQLRYVGDEGVIAVGKVPCAGAPCALQAPKRVKATIGEQTFWARVIAPQRVAAGAKAAVKVRFGGRALAALAGRTITVKVRLRVRQGGETRTRLLQARLRRAALADQPGDPNAPISKPLGSEPPRLARPASAVDVGDVQVTWYPRDSWVRYVSSGEGSSFSGGASGAFSEQSPCPYNPGAPVKQAPPGLPFTVNFLPLPSWFDEASGTAAIYGQGAVNYRYGERGINLTAADPEIEINGPASRAIFRFSGSENTPIASQRAPLVDLDTAGQPATVANGGKTRSYTLMRGALTADGVSIFAGFYQEATNFGCVSISFTTP